MNMFDQFEQAAQRPKKSTNVPANFILMQLEKDLPIFSKTKMNFTPSDKITHVAICSKQLAVAMANGMLFRMNLQSPDEQDGKYKGTVFHGAYHN